MAVNACHFTNQLYTYQRWYDEQERIEDSREALKTEFVSRLFDDNSVTILDIDWTLEDVIDEMFEEESRSYAVLKSLLRGTPQSLADYQDMVKDAAWRLAERIIK